MKTGARRNEALGCLSTNCSQRNPHNTPPDTLIPYSRARPFSFRLIVWLFRTARAEGSAGELEHYDALGLGTPSL